MPYFVYILQCADGTYYTGITTDLKRRFAAHNAGKGAKYLRSRLPFEHVYTEKHTNRSSAQIREAEIKSWTYKQKSDILDAFTKPNFSQNTLPT